MDTPDKNQKAKMYPLKRIIRMYKKSSSFDSKAWGLPSFKPTTARKV